MAVPSDSHWLTHPGYQGSSKQSVSVQLLEQARDVVEVLRALPSLSRDCLSVPLKVDYSIGHRAVEIISADVSRDTLTELDYDYYRQTLIGMAQQISGTYSRATVGAPLSSADLNMPMQQPMVAVGPMGPPGRDGASLADIEIMLRALLTSMKAEIIQQVGDEIQSLVAELRDERR